MLLITALTLSMGCATSPRIQAQEGLNQLKPGLTKSEVFAIPSENKRDVAEVPDAILTAIQWQFYDSPTKAATMAMGLV